MIWFIWWLKVHLFTPWDVIPFGAELYRHYSEYISWDKLHTTGKKKIDAIIHLSVNTDKFGIIPAYSSW